MPLLNWLDRLGDWNPQWFRELKGHLKPRNVAIAALISILGQGLLVLHNLGLLPVDTTTEHPITNIYCTGNEEHYGGYYRCLRDASGQFIINWPQWWLDLFVWFSLLGTFALITVGAYMLINDLAKEEQRGTLNFIRLSPQSTQSILVGKILGVPTLLYLATLLALPLHLWAGLLAQIPIMFILAFYGILIASCTLFYSAALLYTFVTAWLGGFQVWLGGAAVLGFLSMVASLGFSGMPAENPLIWLRLLSPVDFIPALSNSHGFNSIGEIVNLQWFYLPLGRHQASLLGFALLNYSLGIRWIWLSLQRCFRNPHTTLLSKRQSYEITTCFCLLTWGFAYYHFPHSNGDLEHFDVMSFICLLLLDCLLFWYLMVALTPQRQALQDWARYRREARSSDQKLRHSLMQDLIWADKSPSLVAIALNLVIAIAPLCVWLLLTPLSSDLKLGGLVSVALGVSLTLVYATIVQAMVLIKVKNWEFWAIGVVGALVVVPPIVLGILEVKPDQALSFLWFFSVVAPILPLSPGVGLDVFQAAITGLLGQWLLISLLNVQLTRQLKKAGESASKALFTHRSSLPSSPGRITNL